jgi:flagellar basal-body rod protein FlgF
MFSGFYTAASGMLMQQRTLNAIANNIVNRETPGYRAERVISTTFEQEMLTRIERGNTGPIGSASPIRILSEVATVFNAGLITATDSPYDIAINGEGFFCIQGEEDIYLTRNGRFGVDEEGYLVLNGVGRVLGQYGPILVGGAYFTVDADGSIFGQNGNWIDTIRIAVPEQPGQLVKTDNGFYIDEGGAAENIGQFYTVPEGTTLVQFALERSNIEINRELSMLMEAQRNFQACSQILRGIDQINQKAATQIASL